MSAPTLFITGTDHQGWTPVQAEAFNELLPDGSVAVVPDTAYLTQLEAPTETRDSSVSSGRSMPPRPNPTDRDQPDQLSGHAPNRRTGDHPVIQARCRFRLMKRPGVSGASWVEWPAPLRATSKPAARREKLSPFPYGAASKSGLEYSQRRQSSRPACRAPRRNRWALVHV